MRESLARKVMIGAALLVWATTPVRADFDACLAGLRDQAEAAGISNATFDKVTSGLTPNDAESFLDAHRHLIDREGLDQIVVAAGA